MLIKKEDKKMLFAKAAILGIGLIGSSLARNLKQNQEVRELAVYDASPANLQKARELALADICTDSLPEAVKEADVVIFATPVCSFGELAQQIKPCLKKGAIITDVGSVKQYSLQEIEKYLNKDRCVWLVSALIETMQKDASVDSETLIAVSHSDSLPVKQLHLHK